MSREPASVLLVSHAGVNLAGFRRALIGRLLAEGLRVTCAVPQDRYAPELRAMGADVRHYGLARGSLNPLGMLGAARSLGEIIRAVAPDVVHSFTHQPNITSRLAAGPADLVVNSVTGLGSMFLGSGPGGTLKRLLMTQAYRRTARRCRAVVFQNRDDEAFFREHGMLGQCRTVIVRGTGVNVRRFSPRNSPDAVYRPEALALRKGLGIAAKGTNGADTVVVTLAGRLLRDKGVGEFLAAADALAGRFPQAVFLLVGQPDPGNPSNLGPAVMEAARSRPNIKAPGWIDDMALVWAASDVAVLPSYREGLPVTMQEALASGLPVVTTDAPGCREVVDHGVNGFKVPVRDATALADAIGKLLADENLRRDMGQAGRAKAEAEFDADVLAGQMLAVYRDLWRETGETP